MDLFNSRPMIVVFLALAILFGAAALIYDKLIFLSKDVLVGRRDDTKEKMSENESKATAFHALGAEQILAENIEKNLRYLTSTTHVAGTLGSKVQAEWLRKSFKEFGFDKAEMKKYKVLLSYPTEPGSVSLLDNNGREEFKLVSEEKIYNEFENHSGILPPFIAFAEAGSTEGELVYANFGEEEAFKYLKKEKIDLQNCIVIIRYGKFSRRRKIDMAMKYHVKGMILYSDPEPYSPTGKSYPETLFLPKDGTQRGTALPKRGDPLSHGYPAIDGFHRMVVSEKDYLTPLIILPIGFGHAERLMRTLDGSGVPDSSWKGKLNVSYKINSKEKRKVRIKTATKQEDRFIYDVIGTMEGAVEPDRLVLLGNHRDAWAFGAADPSSGTATMVEIARVLGWLKRKGNCWKPRRSILLCSWDAEEYGLVGSTEWGEENEHVLSHRAVAYINVDSAVQGNYTVEFKSTPSLADAFSDVIKMLKNPANKTENLYDSWVKKKGDKNQPDETIFGMSSDYMQFYSALGISSMDLRFEFDPYKVLHNKIFPRESPLGDQYPVYHSIHDNFDWMKRFVDPDFRYHEAVWKCRNESPLGDQYPVYHSIHDNFDWMKRFVDPDFRYHEAIGKMLMFLALKLADSVLLPFNLLPYGENVIQKGNKIVEMKDEVGGRIKNYDIDFLTTACKNFKEATSKFHEKLQKIDKKDALAVRMANDKMMLLERGFVVTEDIVGERTRHMYHTSGLKTAFDDVVKDKPGSVEDLQLKITVFTHHVRMATMILQDNLHEVIATEQGTL